MRDAGVTTGKRRDRKCGSKVRDNANKREYKMRDLIATTARRLERNTDDVLFHKGSPGEV